MLMTLDIANAFNSVSWEAIIQVPIKKRVPGYLVRIIRSHLKDLVVMYGEEDTATQISCGVPRGWSVLGPLLWNAMFDGLLRTKIPEGVVLIGCLDYVALVGLSSASKNQYK